VPHQPVGELCRIRRQLDRMSWRWLVNKPSQLRNSAPAMRTMIRKAFWNLGLAPLNVRLPVLLPLGASLLQVTLRDTLFAAKSYRRVTQFDQVRERGNSLSYRLRFAVLLLVSLACPFDCDSKRHLRPAFVGFVCSARSEATTKSSSSDFLLTGRCLRRCQDVRCYEVLR
jgi:hypothetical protein